LQIEGDRACDVWAGHTRASAKLRAAANRTREDAHARSGEIHVRAVVARAREAVVVAERNPAVVHRRAERARLAIKIGETRDGYDFGESCGDKVGGISRVVPGGDRVADAGGN
jgi:hypothetical protein